MPFYFGDVMRTIFGLPPRSTLPSDEYWNSNWNNLNDDEDDGYADFSASDHNDLFNDAHDMHRIFQKQFNDILKLFDMDIGESFGQHDNFFEESRQVPPKRSIRDEYLKPGYQKNLPIGSNDKVDSDVDGVIAPRDLNEFFGQSNNTTKPNGHFENYNIRPSPEGGFFGRVVITQTTTRPDGTVETRRTVRDSRNNEETTVTIRENDHQNNEIKEFNPNRRIPLNDPISMWEKFFGKF